MSEQQKPTPWQYVWSILAAAFGVQSQRARERDFNHGNPWVFILGGLGFTILLIVTLIVVVQIIIS